MSKCTHWLQGIMTHLYLSFGTKTLRGECCTQLECGFSDAAGLSFVTVTYFHFNQLQCVIVHFLALNIQLHWVHCLVTFVWGWLQQPQAECKHSAMPPSSSTASLLMMRLARLGNKCYHPRVAGVTSGRGYEWQG